MPNEYIDQFHPPVYAPGFNPKDLDYEKIVPITDPKILISTKEKWMKESSRLSQLPRSSPETIKLQENVKKLAHLIKISDEHRNTGRSHTLS